MTQQSILHLFVNWEVFTINFIRSHISGKQIWNDVIRQVDNKIDTQAMEFVVLVQQGGHCEQSPSVYQFIMLLSNCFLLWTYGEPTKGWSLFSLLY